MLLIAIDTSGRKGSVALCRGDADRFETLELTSLEGGTYSARLMPTIAGLLQENGFDKTRVGGFVVVAGPGSFTGLRVGLATVKALCEVLRRPLATVSTLEALAVTYCKDGETVTAVLDAGRDEIYIGEYHLAGRSASLAREYIAKLGDFAAKEHSGRLLTPDTLVADILSSSGKSVERVAAVHADGVGRIGLRKLLAGEVADPASVDVNYIRRSDAEIFSTPKR